ncbi:hypothetical protein HanXRQr2_Chr08g0361011 [Helianthus annuus]|uniref:Uncharacterized protein n=1 Tax=Helianthus annuus TaxID=4232 RepID=A0A9K3IIP7_HELAN|nr:hypothetical protein HanXRQr2_Chr08g0361011 [Helianthus annuus]
MAKDGITSSSQHQQLSFFSKLQHTRSIIRLNIHNFCMKLSCTIFFREEVYVV